MKQLGGFFADANRKSTYQERFASLQKSFPFIDAKTVGQWAACDLPLSACREALNVERHLPAPPPPPPPRPPAIRRQLHRSHGGNKRKSSERSIAKPEVALPAKLQARKDELLAGARARLQRLKRHKLTPAEPRDPPKVVSESAGASKSADVVQHNRTPTEGLVDEQPLSPTAHGEVKTNAARDIPFSDSEPLGKRRLFDDSSDDESSLFYSSDDDDDDDSSDDDDDYKKPAALAGQDTKERSSNSNDVVPRSTAARQRLLRPLAIVPLATAKKKLDKMLKIKKKLSGFWQKYTLKVEDFCRRFLKVFHPYSLRNGILPRELLSTIAKHGCVYKFPDGKTGETSRRGWIRVDEQIPDDSPDCPRDVAVVVYDTAECEEVMSQPCFEPFLEEAIALRPPGLQYHEEMEKERDGAMCRQILEMAVAACTEGETREVMEKFTKTPTNEINGIVALPASHNPKAVALLRSIREIDPTLTWPPLSSFLQELKTSDILSEEEKAWLCDRLKDLPTNEFLQWDMVRRLCGFSDMLLRFTNAVSDDVRANQLDEIVQVMNESLSPDVMQHFSETRELPEAVSAAMHSQVSTIHRGSGDYDSYKPPEREALAAGGVRELRRKRNQKRDTCRPNQVLLLLEFVTPPS